MESPKAEKIRFLGGHVMNLIRIEFMKLKKSNVWISAVIIPMISVLLGSGNYYLNREILKSEWYSLWTQVSLFYGFFFYTITIAIICSYSWRMEHKDNNWNRILALPYSYLQLIISKIVSVSIVSLCIQAIFLIFYYVTGKFIFGFKTGFPPEVFIWVGISWIISISVCSMQSFISMNIKSFSVPVGVALFLCFIGIGFYVFEGLGENLVYFSPNSLLIKGMSSNETEMLKISEYIKMLISTLLFTVFFIYLSIISIKKIRN